MKYNWKSTGPGGCDTHCIESPCGPCITGGYRNDYLEKKVAELEVELEKADALANKWQNDWAEQLERNVTLTERAEQDTQVMRILNARLIQLRNMAVVINQPEMVAVVDGMRDDALSPRRAKHPFKFALGTANLCDTCGLFEGDEAHALSTAQDTPIEHCHACGTADYQTCMDDCPALARRKRTTQDDKAPPCPECDAWTYGLGECACGWKSSNEGNKDGR